MISFDGSILCRSLNAKSTPEAARKTAPIFTNDIFSILKIVAIVMVIIGIVAYISPPLAAVVNCKPNAQSMGNAANIDIPIR